MKKRNIYYRKNSQGFTLIELLTVIAIIGVLTALLTFSLLGVRGRGRDAQRKSSIKQIQSALELYRADNDTYPAATAGGYFGTCGAPFTNGLGTTYMDKVPCDPSSNVAYGYQLCSTGACYTIVSCIENTGDTDTLITATRPSWLGFSCPSSKYYVATNP